MNRFTLILISLCFCCVGKAQNGLLNQPMDLSAVFSDVKNTYFLADSLAEFNPQSGEGKVTWQRYRLSPRQAFNTNGLWPVRLKMLDFPDAAYDNDPSLRFQVRFVSPRTLRLTMYTTPIEAKDTDDANDIMLCKVPAVDKSWKVVRTKDGVCYRSEYGSLEIKTCPWRIVLRDSKGRIMTQSRTLQDNDSSQVKLLPFCFVKRGDNNQRMVNPVFSLFPEEKIFGLGESFSPLNKVGQKVQLFVTDPQGPETQGQYKPVPFYMSSRGYGVFMHTSAPATCDFGASYIGTQSLMMADEKIDLFIFLGSPKDVLYEYTGITGRSPLPPLWTFGTWMSRISYFSQQEGLDVAKKLRENRIPSDVIHFDTGWFETDWQCDYKFAPSRFPNAGKMLSSLKKDGFHTCLWQLPYFTPKNRYFKELLDSGMAVRNAAGTSSYEDAVLDLSNPKTVAWYQDKIAGLLRLGVSATKCDFGEAAPVDGLYHSGTTGLYEHNLFPLRYNKALSEAVSRETNGDGVIWARSAWAGSQRYPLHWGGDAATTDVGMLGDLRGGLSFGLSGFSFWSHDIGGFVTQSPDDLYKRWLPFGFLSSHSRAHGAPPTEPWLINDDMVRSFRQSAEMKYRLMPYVYAQAKECSMRGLPMVRALFVEFPEDKGAWLVEDEYMFGSQILVAPLLESGTSRSVYLPQGRWIDYQSGKAYEGGYQEIETGKIPCVIMVRDGSLIPHAPLAQNTSEIDWNKVELRPYRSSESVKCTGLLFAPGDKKPHTIVK